MPELPDVEVFRQYVDATSLHRSIEAVKVDAPRMLKGATPKRVRSRLEGAELATTRRHGKYLLIELSGGPWLFLHFGMTGRLDYARRDDGPPRHARLSIDFSNGYRLAGRSSAKPTPSRSRAPGCCPIGARRKAVRAAASASSARRSAAERPATCPQCQQ